MIKLEKGEQPTVLRDNEAAWLAEIAAMVGRNEDASVHMLSRYRHKDIKAALLDECHGKCAYCESAFGHVTYGDVEHIIPKKVRPDLRFSWENLTIACDICNTRKGTHEDVLDPYEVDPANCFMFQGALIWADPSNDAAVSAERRLDLNRHDLVERRTERLDFIRNLVATASLKPESVRELLLAKATEETSERTQFSAFSKEALLRIKQRYGW